MDRTLDQFGGRPLAGSDPVKARYSVMRCSCAKVSRRGGDGCRINQEGVFPEDAAMVFSSIRSRPDSQSPAAALMLTGQMQQDLDSVIDRLAAPTIAESGLHHVLAQGVDVLLAGSGIGWSLSLDHDIEQRSDAAPEVARQVLLITFEAVANALKHSRCSHCSIGGARTGNMIAWTISDNGSAPFPTNIVSKGMGLANMRLRANGLPGGEFTIIPEAGGATVRVIFYLPASDKP